MQDRLFVYGTLMRGFDHPMAKLLSRSAEFIGEARCQGRLYLVKHYPGLVLSDDRDDVVFGELYRLRTPEESFATLDEYEGCGPGVASPQYLRQVLPVTLDDGTVSEAWTYVYNRPVAKLQRITSGRFLEGVSLPRDEATSGLCRPPFSRPPEKPRSRAASRRIGHKCLWRILRGSPQEAASTSG